MKKILLSIAVLAGFSVSAQEPATNSEIAGNIQVSDGTGFELKFNTQGTLDQSLLNCVEIYDTFGAKNAAFSVDSTDDGNGYLKVSFNNYDTLSGNTRLGSNRLPVGQCATAANGTEGANIKENPVIKARVRATTNVSLVLTAATLDGGSWITHDASLTVQEVVGNAKWTNVEFQIADTSWNGFGNLEDLIGWEIWAAAGSELSAGEIHFDHITFGATDFATSTNEVVASRLSLFPNPVSDMLTVNFEATSSTSVQLIDLTGKVVRSETAQAGSVSTQFDVNDLNAGVYFVNVKNTVGSTTQKFVVK